MFHSIARCLSSWLNTPVTMPEVRSELAAAISVKNAPVFVRMIQEDQRLFSLVGSIPISSITAGVAHGHVLRDKVRGLIKTEGPLFQGSDVALRFFLAFSKFARASRLGCVTFSSHGPAFTAVIPPMDLEPQEWYLCLFCSANAHWKSATVFGKYVISRLETQEFIDQL